MFELVMDQPSRELLRLDDGITAEIAATSASLRFASSVVWAEHCTECVWPTCYSTCALYTPRSDLKCRRLVRGIEPIRVALPDGGAVDGMRVAFRQWGKLEATGRVSLFAQRRVARRTRRDDRARGVLNTLPAPYAIKQRMGWQWLEHQQAQAAGGQPLGPEDVFLIEAVNEGEHSVALTLVVVPKGDRDRFFQDSIVLEPGYNRTMIPAAAVAAYVDLSEPLVIRVEPTRPDPAISLIFTRLDWARLDRVLPSRPQLTDYQRLEGPKVKCVVWDLDETLWQGILLEDGPEGIVLRPEVAEIIKELDERGILQSVASKNDPDSAAAVLAELGLTEYFLHPQIGWGPKSTALATIRAALNIGADTLLFVDDQPFERAEVAAAHPEVRVLDSADLSGLLQREDLRVPVTPESRRRRKMYAEEAGRVAAAEVHSTFDEFLRTCAITLDLIPVDESNQERIFELSQRTNQLNYSGNRASRSDIDAMTTGTSRLKSVALQVTDRFGDYGIVGLATLDTDTFTMTDFFMSCRVQRKKIENAFFGRLLELGLTWGFDTLRIRYHATGRNGPALEVLAGLGAVAEEDERDGTAVYVLPCAGELPGRDLVTIGSDVLSTWEH